MARRLMSKRGGSASQPQVTPYQQIEVDDGWREWENTKQELVLVKRQLIEKDELVLQLKTASRRLQETLRKKEKDLQAAFAILRSPQDAKTTKTRKHELMDRLVTESTQRAVNAEALAEERGRELNRLKYSSKFLRFQELEVEIEECHLEIKRLRTKLETSAATSPMIIGKMKVSSVPSTIGSPAKKVKPVSPDVTYDRRLESKLSGSDPIKLSPSRTLPSLSAHGIGQVRVIPLSKYDHREGFVSKTRRRALEAEHYKQVRLAQLEVECELEENLHIRAAREAKKIQLAEQSERQAALSEEAASALQAALTLAAENRESISVESIDDTNRSHHDTACDVSTRINTTLETLDAVQSAVAQKDDDSSVSAREAEGITLQNAGVDTQAAKYSAQQNAGVSTDREATASELSQTHDQTETNQVYTVPGTPQNTENKTASNPDEDVADDHTDEATDAQGVRHQNSVEGHEDSDKSRGKQQQYEEEEFDGSDDDAISDSVTTKPDDKERSVWNLDPAPGGINLHDKEEESRSGQHDLQVSAGNDAESSGRTAVWNVDPNPLTPTVEQEHDEESDTRRETWNVDLHPDVPEEVNSATSLDALVVNNEKETIASDSLALLPAGNAPNEENAESKAWNLDPIPAPTSDGPVITGSVNGERVERSAFVQEDDAQVDDARDDVTSSRKAWNVDPKPNPAPQPYMPNTDASHSVDERVVWNLDPDPTPPVTYDEDAIHGVEERVVWNLDPNPSSELSPGPSSAITGVAVGHGGDVSDDNPDAAWNVDPNPPALSKESGNDGNIDEGTVRNPNNYTPPQSIANDPPPVSINDHPTELVSDSTRGEGNTTGAWNLDPTSPARVLEPQERASWNLNPHSSDFSSPDLGDMAYIDDVEIPQDDDGGITMPRTIEDDPPIDDDNIDVPVPASPKEQEDSAVMHETSNTREEKSAPSDAGDANVVGTDPHYASSDHNSLGEFEEDGIVGDYTPDYTPPSTARDSETVRDEEDPSW